MIIIALMRYPPEHKQRVRERIVRAAARGFRSRGGDGVAIADLMRELDLTHGGFYRHFEGKEELFDEALLAAMAQTEERLRAAAESAPPGKELQAIVDTYLGERHCARPGQGCPIAALTTEIARHGKRTRRTLEHAVERHAAGLSRFLPGATAEERTRAAIVLFSGMAGVLNLARAVADPALRRSILDAGRRFYVEAFTPAA